METLTGIYLNDKDTLKIIQGSKAPNALIFSGNKLILTNHRSECDMKRRTCGQLVVEAPMANCEGTRHCSTNLAAPRCPRSKKHKMICGSDNQFYSNECQMKRENCG